MMLIKNKSRSRRLQYDWLSRIAGKVGASPKVVDLGGVRGAEYHNLLGLVSDEVEVWNFDPSSQPNRIVDLDQIDALPDLPSDTQLVVAMNLLEHLYRPFDLLAWVCRQLPSQGKLLICVPFSYPIHPSPNDFWRISPQAFERRFVELAEKEGLKGSWQIEPLGEDLREGTDAWTAPLFKGSRTTRLMATAIETSAFVASEALGLFVGRERLRKWAQENPPAIGILWTKGDA